MCIFLYSDFFFGLGKSFNLLIPPTTFEKERGEREKAREREKREREGDREGGRERRERESYRIFLVQ
jgi:hypothetical protein